MTSYPKFTAMLTDLYELTMAQVYYREGMFKPATFSLFIREYPPNRGYFISAGLENALAFLESARFMPDDIQYLDSTGLFSHDFLNYLAGFRFTGDVVAVPEGELFFKDEPVLEVTAPIIEAQLVETALINIIHLQVTLATKVSRCVHAARGRSIVDFSLRRTHGVDAGMAVARAGYIAGMSATSNVLAGKIYGIPVAGTMAHSFITSFESEINAFRAFADIFGDRTVLLIDTYDTLAGAEKAVTVAREMKAQDRRLRGVRLDSGDMTELSRQVRDLFRREGVPDIQIFASGGYDEFKIDRSIREGAEIDAFGVGTKMGVSADSPYADIAYKLVQFDSRPVMKLSSGKRTLVAPKQVFREEQDGRLAKDTISLREESLAGRPLLKTVMQDGKAVDAPEPLNVIRERFRSAFEKLPEEVRAITDPEPYSVGISERLTALQRKVRHSVIAKELGES
ncbi:nicotinate phosphoribosyltransferase [Desulfococcus multivorans]|nr:nicotinate phosphoribosyltransferase [Desulfococcus multivorans]MDX9819538.1 nicotinate phosphoribosyltransferase [Desulfococcus multivorans]